MLEEEITEARSEGAEWIKKVVEKLRERGFDFEYEGESLRFHVGELVVEVTTHPEGGYMVSIQVPLPGPDEQYSDTYAKLMDTAVKVFTKLKGNAEYQLDTSLLDYPMLHMVRRYQDPWKMVDEVIRAIEELEA